MTARATLALALSLAIGAAHAADPLDTRLRPALPSSVRTVSQAAAYYSGAIGYRYYTRTPAAGDFRKVAATPPPVLSLTAPTPLRALLLSLVGTGTAIYVDHEQRAIAFGPAVDARREIQTALFVAPEAVAATEPEVVAEPVVALTSGGEPSHVDAASPAHPQVPTSPPRAIPAAPAPAIAAAPAPVIEPVAAVASDAAPVVADVSPPPAVRYDVHAGEALDAALVRWAEREGVTLIWTPAWRVRLRTDAEIHADTLREAIVALLTPLVHTGQALRARETAQHEITIEALQ
jgi:hypothetical protein